MLNSFPFALSVATLLGILAGLGIGGGSLLILWLTAVLAVPYSQARVINLLFFLPAAAVASLLRKKHLRGRQKEALPAMIAGSVMAAVFYWVSGQMDIFLLKKCFGGILLIAAIRELRYTNKP